MSNNNLLSVPFELICDETLLPIHEINYEQKGKDKFIEQLYRREHDALPTSSPILEEKGYWARLHKTSVTTTGTRTCTCNSSQLHEIT